MTMPRYVARNHGALACLALALCACQLEPAPALDPAPDNTLRVAVRPGPASWYPGPYGAPIGADYDLLERFAAERGLTLSIVEVDSAATLFAKIAAGEVHLGLGGLYPAADETRPVIWTSASFATEPVLIYHRDDARPRTWKDLHDVEVAYADATGIEAQLAAVRETHGGVRWRAVAVPSSERLIAQVCDGDVDAAIVPSIDVAAMRNVLVDFDVAFAAGPKHDQAWAVAPDRVDLRDEIDRYFAQARSDGTLARLADRYFAQAGQVERIDAGIFRDRVQTVLPRYRGLFEDVQSVTGVEWRLLAAVAYQESRWDPLATSETGVRGFMQITEDTALRLGVDRLDPIASTAGAGRYLAALKARLPARIAEPDRTWFALAAFNIGPGHLEDARVLAQRQKLNPDSWADVRKALPLLAEPEHYERARNGYARGGMPVAFVDRVRAFYDILLRHAPATAPRVETIALAETR
jgi:membrane-bound lytic murein transglycosylase F